MLSAAALLLAGALDAAEFSAGFARVDITPPYGCFMPGYYSIRHGKGVLDPLEASCVAFSDGTRTALVCSVDNISLENEMVDAARRAVSAAFPARRSWTTASASRGNPRSR